MKAIRLDRDKYIQMARAQGVDAALTQLHLDIERMEYETFEGDKGYQPDMFMDLDEVRMFSRDLWQLALDADPAASKSRP